jgi:uncharacterized repeat protein (TIGR01451 family)
LLPSLRSNRLSVTLASLLHRSGTLVLLALLLACSHAVAQSDLKQPADRTDVGQSIKTLSADSQQLQAPMQDTGAQRLIRIVPFGRTANSASTGIKSQAPAGAHLTYWGGAVISNIQVVAVFWGPSVSSSITANGAIDQFYTDIVNSRYFDLLTEYTTAGITGNDGVSTSNQTIGRGTFGGKFTITPSLCPGTAACTVNDTQIQTELAAQINGGHLPAPQTDVHGIVNTYYAIYFPPNVTIALDPITKSCVAGGFCAYHSDTGSNIPYGVLPDFSSGGCSFGCGGGTTFQIATGVSSHEMGEAVTDAEVGTATVFGPPLGWYDHVPPPGTDLGEIADICDPFVVPVNAGANTYTVELLFSNLQTNCVSAPPVLNMPSPPGGAGPNVPFNMTLSILSSVQNTVGSLTGYRGTVHFTSPDPGATLPADYTFTATDGGVHNFPFTLTLLGNQTITVTDTRSSGFTGTTTVNVNTVPNMTLTLQHAGNFATGQTGVYTITAINAGGGPSSATVTIIDTLPNGMTAAAMSGTGWTCNVNTVTCTRADALAAGSSYPAISLTVNISSPATQLTNTATISGGGESVTSDDVATDLTTIVNPGVHLSLSVSPQQIFTTQGATGVTLSTVVGNGGSVATSGAVTLTEILPAGVTATALSGTGWNCTLANLSCTRSDALASALNYPSVTLTVNVALNATLGLFSVSTAISGGGDATPPSPVTTSFEINASLAIVGNTPSITVSAGVPAKFLVQVSATAAAGTVTFSCSGLPAASSCSFSPATLANSSANVTMTVSTTARSAVVTWVGPRNRVPWLWLPLLSVIAMAAWWVRTRRGAMPPRKLVPILGAATLVLASLLIGCGGGGGGGTTIVTQPQGTPAGTYTLTFIAAGANGSVTRTMTLVVQ